MYCKQTQGPYLITAIPNGINNHTPPIETYREWTEKNL